MSGDIASEFVGTWRLISYSAVTSGGETIYPMGRNAHGRIIYEAGGRMAVQLGDPNRAPFAASDPVAATDAEVRTAFDGYLAYYGHTPSTPTGGSSCTTWRYLCSPTGRAATRSVISTCKGGGLP
jgi:hypothetical protein